MLPSALFQPSGFDGEVLLQHKSGCAAKPSLRLKITPLATQGNSMRTIAGLSYTQRLQAAAGQAATNALPCSASFQATRVAAALVATPRVIAGERAPCPPIDARLALGMVSPGPPVAGISRPRSWSPQMPCRMGSVSVPQPPSVPAASSPHAQSQPGTPSMSMRIASLDEDPATALARLRTGPQFPLRSSTGPLFQATSPRRERSAPVAEGLHSDWSFDTSRLDASVRSLLPRRDFTFRA
jgi:hypothetical protein